MIELFGVVLAVIGVGAYTPQILRSFRTKDQRGVYSVTLIVAIQLSVIWTVYGIAKGLPAVIIGSLGALAGQSAIALRLRGGEKPVHALVAVFSLGIAFGVTASVFGLEPAMSVASVGSCVEIGAQAAHSFRADCLSGVSLGYWLYSTAVGLGWGIYSAGVSSVSLAIWSISYFLICGTISINVFLFRVRVSKDRRVVRRKAVDSVMLTGG